jgi:murein DD-endopeptidase MepM/ murein hydrolase activator NlpD
MTEHSEAAPDGRSVRPATSDFRRWVVLAVSLAIGFVSGVSALQQDTAEDDGEVVARFDPVSIDELPLYSSDEIESTDPSMSVSLESDVEPEPLISVTKGELAEGQKLAGVLAKLGTDTSLIDLISKKLRPLFDFRHSRPGHRFRLAVDAEGNLVDFRYSTSIEESIYLFWDGQRYAVRRDYARLEPRIATLAGLVETSLYDSVRSLGEDPQLADDFAMIFAWDIDFTRNVKSGDAFRVLYERLYFTDDDGEEVYVRPGRILAARYHGGVGEYSAVYFETEEGRGGYYRPDGSSIEGAFLVAPLRYTRISSSYTNARRHPILNVTRRHPGVDYAAAEGTQVWAVADGTVVFRGWAGASGNLVKVRHANGYVSHYAHLSRFPDRLDVGQRVQQKEVIGYVGHTGLATGAHVCFRITENGRYVNPLAIQSPSRSLIPAHQRGDFFDTRDELLAGLDFGTMAASDEAL